MLRFASPWFFLLLLLVPFLIWYRRWRHRPPTMASSALFPVVGIGSSAVLRLQPLVPAIKYMALVLIIVALARPQWGTERTEVQTEGINIVLALDLSTSMAALDFKKRGGWSTASRRSRAWSRILWPAAQATVSAWWCSAPMPIRSCR